jgi:molecular chaperone DnaJ
MGDLLVTVEVETPRDLTAEARAAVEAFRTASADHDPRAPLLSTGGGHG